MIYFLAGTQSSSARRASELIDKRHGEARNDGLFPEKFMTRRANFDDSVEARDCSKGQFTSVDFEVTEVENLPLPSLPSSMYTTLMWKNGYNEDTATEIVANVTVTTALRRTLSEVVDENRQASWESSGWFHFDAPCGEDRIIFDIYAENSGYINPEVPNADQLIFNYPTRASVSDYYELVGEATSCWYIERDSQPISDFYGSQPSRRFMYMKWCVKVRCNEDDSCYQTLSAWQWVTILMLFLFPAVLCICCLCCMSNRTANYAGISRRWSLNRITICWNWLFHHSENDNQVRERNLQLDVEINATVVDAPRSGRIMARNRHLPTRVNYIKLQSECTLETLGKDEAACYSEEGEDPICAICLSQLLPKEKVKKLPCKHIFHASCVDLWGETSTTCPLCKFDVHEPKRGDQSEGGLRTPSITSAVRNDNNSMVINDENENNTPPGTSNSNSNEGPEGERREDETSESLF